MNIIPHMNDDGLLECPFCSCLDIGLDVSSGGWSYGCNNCGASSYIYMLKSGARNSWNTRRGKLHTLESINRSHEEGDFE